jgi:hypothetical protein
MESAAATATIVDVSDISPPSRQASKIFSL